MWLGSSLAWLWCRPAATALIRLLAWELPYAVGVALKSKKKKKLGPKEWVRISLGSGPSRTFQALRHTCVSI